MSVEQFVPRIIFAFFFHSQERDDGDSAGVSACFCLARDELTFVLVDTSLHSRMAILSLITTMSDLSISTGRELFSVLPSNIRQWTNFMTSSKYVFNAYMAEIGHLESSENPLKESDDDDDAKFDSTKVRGDDLVCRVHLVLAALECSFILAVRNPALTAKRF